MSSRLSCLVASVSALALLGAGAAAQSEEAIEFGETADAYAGDGVCADPRFDGDSMADDLTEAGLKADATECEALFAAGEITLKADDAADIAEEIDAAVGELEEDAEAAVEEADAQTAALEAPAEEAETILQDEAEATVETEASNEADLTTDAEAETAANAMAADDLAAEVEAEEEAEAEVEDEAEAETEAPAEVEETEDVVAAEDIADTEAAEAPDAATENSADVEADAQLAEAADTDALPTPDTGETADSAPEDERESEAAVTEISDALSGTPSDSVAPEDEAEPAADVTAALDGGLDDTAQDAEAATDVNLFPDVEPTETPASLPETATIDFGDDTSEFANDGECDDARFAGEGMTNTDLITEDIGHDATDCRLGIENGTLRLRDESDADLDVVIADPEDMEEVQASGRVTGIVFNGIDFGNDTSDWANDGECDDPRFKGDGMTNTRLLPEDAFRDASDCLAAWKTGKLMLARD